MLSNNVEIRQKHLPILEDHEGSRKFRETILYEPFWYKKVTLYRYVSRTNMFFFDFGLKHNPSPNPNTM
jgi:hypothetical protein